MTHRTKTATIVSAMRELARTVQCDDGIANAAISEAADRLLDLDARMQCMSFLLADCIAVIRTIEGDNSDECEALAELIEKVDKAMVDFFDLS